MQHFLQLTDFPKNQLDNLLLRAELLKYEQQTQGKNHHTLSGKHLVMIFEKASTRTRLSFEIGMSQLGGKAIFVSSNESQLGRGEPIKDTARVVSSMADIVMIRTYKHQCLEEFIQYAEVPVINALSDSCHPCQLLADMLTIKEHFGFIKSNKIAWIGDGNNVCNSYINAAIQFNFELNIYSPEGYQPSSNLLQIAKDNNAQVKLCKNPQEAVKDADVVTTDVWLSMGQEAEKSQRLEAFKHCCVDGKLINQAKSSAIFLHCLPAHRGEEVTNAVIESQQSLVFQQAENRLHVQKSLLETLLHTVQKPLDFK